MNARRIVAIAAAGAVAAGGAGVAIASVATKDDPKQAEQSILDNAAKRLDVAPQKLREALAGAEDDQLEQAVKNGDLTRAQADAIKQRRAQSGNVLGPGGGPPRLLGPGGGPLPPPRRGGPGGPGEPAPELFSDLAKALGLDLKQLGAKLRDGKSFADIAKAQGKSLKDVRSTLEAAAKTRLDKAVDAGKLTRKQADAVLAHVDERLKHLDVGPRLRLHRLRRFRGGPPAGGLRGGPPPDMKPGALAPAPGGHPPDAASPIPF